VCGTVRHVHCLLLVTQAVSVPLVCWLVGFGWVGLTVTDMDIYATHPPY